MAERGYPASLQVCVAVPEVLRQSSPGARAEQRAGLSPRHQAAGSILSSSYFYEEPAPSSTLAKSVIAWEGFKLQPSLAPSSHTIFSQKPLRAWQALPGESREPVPQLPAALSSGDPQYQ